ncbi:MAG: hypothetical protein KGM91_18895 [Burkholderiales bacterium]|nr:hypothetical protein [Burkholderiales bacterium]
MSADPFAWTIDRLRGKPLPPIPERAGRIVTAYDEPIADDELRGATVEEARRILGGTRERAERRMAEINNASSDASTKD